MSLSLTCQSFACVASRPVPPGKRTAVTQYPTVKGRSHDKYLFQQVSTAGRQLTLVYLPISSVLLRVMKNSFQISHYLSSITLRGFAFHRFIYFRSINSIIRLWVQLPYKMEFPLSQPLWDICSCCTCNMEQLSWRHMIPFIQSLYMWKLCFMTFLRGSGAMERLNTCVQCGWVSLCKEGNAAEVRDPRKALLFFKSPVCAKCRNVSPEEEGVAAQLPRTV